MLILYHVFTRQKSTVYHFPEILIETNVSCHAPIISCIYTSKVPSFAIHSSKRMFFCLVLILPYVRVNLKGFTWLCIDRETGFGKMTMAEKSCIILHCLVLFCAVVSIRVCSKKILCFDQKKNRPTPCAEQSTAIVKDKQRTNQPLEENEKPRNPCKYRVSGV